MNPLDDLVNKTMAIIKNDKPALFPKWCECASNDENDIHKGDDECTCGLRKHHSHCSSCGCVTQTG